MQAFFFCLFSMSWVIERSWLKMCCSSSFFFLPYWLSLPLHDSKQPVSLLSTPAYCTSLLLLLHSSSTTPLALFVFPLAPRLRSVKMEQRKLHDQANTLVDLAKVGVTSFKILNLISVYTNHFESIQIIVWCSPIIKCQCVMRKLKRS